MGKVTFDLRRWRGGPKQEFGLQGYRIGGFRAKAMEGGSVLGYGHGGGV